MCLPGIDNGKVRCKVSKMMGALPDCVYGRADMQSRDADSLLASHDENRAIVCDVRISSLEMFSAT